MYREKKENYYHFTFLFNECISTDEAKKELNRIKRWIEYNKAKNNWEVSGKVGLSYGDSRYGEVKTTKTGKPGRPRKEYEAYRGYEGEGYKKIHIHVGLYAKPGATFEKAFRQYGKKVLKDKEPYNTKAKLDLDRKRISNYIDYQCTNIREIKERVAA